MIVAVEPVLALVANEDIRPAVVIEIAYGHAKTPALVRYAGLLGNIRKCSIMVVVKKRRMRSRSFATQRIVCRSIHQIDVQPAVVVVIKQANTRSVRIDNELLIGITHLMPPGSKPRLLRDVLKDHRSGIDKASSS